MAGGLSGALLLCLCAAPPALARHHQVLPRHHQILARHHHALFRHFPASVQDSPCIDCGLPCIDCDLPCIDCDGSFRRDDETPFSDNPPLPEGFVLTVPVGADREQDETPSTAVLNRYPEVAGALSRCFDPAASLGTRSWGEITLRVSFKRDGSVNGIPRVIYPAGPSDPALATELKSSLLSALAHCTPLHLSPSLGGAIAGQIFAIRFTQQG
jgi:hypothetical protein